MENNEESFPQELRLALSLLAHCNRECRHPFEDVGDDGDEGFKMALNSLFRAEKFIKHLTKINPD